MIVSSPKTRKENEEELTDYTDEDVNNNEEEEDDAIHNVPNTFVWKVDSGIKKNHCFFLPKDRYNCRKIRIW